ncbi:hypothetical protein NG895_04765 [Aeoliella sp. ICT_H6.2]|uniref:Uncharacterized protein n=1 Tax=Aeoliella straminimaris TaxID=2954799 RepID=A0A9X2F7E3_9BACT|nr:hypothetical protein [Aeoliella straminimaris]MCO6043209.1 hypothetical protein [Aeoliella straminimaris]
MSKPATSEFDPYHKWLGIPPSEQPPNHYRLLGLSEFEDDPDVIAAAADRQMGHVKGFATGRYGSYSQELLNELAKVRVCLLNAKLKQAYDAKLRQALQPKPPAAPPAKPASPTAPPTQVIPPPTSAARVAPPAAASNEPTELPTIGPRRTIRRRRKKPSAAPILFALAIATLAMVGLAIYFANKAI